MNTDLRKRAKNDFKRFFKLMNNTIYCITKFFTENLLEIEIKTRDIYE